eukprot:GHVP01014827.1.p1 GENE.GHVP01014827.1~~GHVP01014827.1.p1  ORF type:complete len:595 (-),score=93.96 GHVP01014827.1:5451-7202(-)
MQDIRGLLAPVTYKPQPPAPQNASITTNSRTPLSNVQFPPFRPPEIPHLPPNPMKPPTSVPLPTPGRGPVPNLHAIIKSHNDLEIEDRRNSVIYHTYSSQDPRRSRARTDNVTIYWKSLDIQPLDASSSLYISESIMSPKLQGEINPPLLKKSTTLNWAIDRLRAASSGRWLMAKELNWVKDCREILIAGIPRALCSTQALNYITKLLGIAKHDLDYEACLHLVGAESASMLFGCPNHALNSISLMSCESTPTNPSSTFRSFTYAKSDNPEECKQVYVGDTGYEVVYLPNSAPTQSLRMLMKNYIAGWLLWSKMKSESPSVYGSVFECVPDSELCMTLAEAIASNTNVLAVHNYLKAAADVRNDFRKTPSEKFWIFLPGIQSSRIRSLLELQEEDIEFLEELDGGFVAIKLTESGNNASVSFESRSFKIPLSHLKRSKIPPPIWEKASYFEEAPTAQNKLGDNQSPSQSELSDLKASDVFESEELDFQEEVYPPNATTRIVVSVIAFRKKISFAVLPNVAPTPTASCNSPGSASPKKTSVTDISPRNPQKRRKEERMVVGGVTLSGPPPSAKSAASKKRIRKQ